MIQTDGALHHGRVDHWDDYQKKWVVVVGEGPHQGEEMLVIGARNGIVPLVGMEVSFEVAEIPDHYTKGQYIFFATSLEPRKSELPLVRVVGD